MFGFDILSSVGTYFSSYLYSAFITIAFLIPFLCIIFYKYIKDEKNNRFVKKAMMPNKYNVEYGKRKPNKTRYNKSKFPDYVDTIVIGSGIGGLTTAGYLAKAGQQVLVLEQHDIAGGSTHAFVDHGDEFDTGVHYIGNMEKRKVVLDQITDTPIEWDQLGHEIYNKTDGVPDYVYDEVYIGTGDKRECYKFRAGEKNFTYDLVEKFPEEEDFIRKYVSLIKKVAKKDMFFMAKIIRPSWLADIVLKYFCNDYYKWVNTTTYQILSAMTNNKKLISVLCGQFGDQGRTPKTSSFFMHASIVNHYLKGAWYPRGGSAEFANKIIPTIEKAGGRVLVGKAVKRIIIVNNRAIGVVMENDDKIFAHNVVSSAGIYNTYHKLMHEKHASSDPLYQLTINYGTNSQESIQIKPSCTMIYLFVGLDKTSEELQLRSSNIWSLPCKQEYDYDMDKMMNDYLNDYTNDMPIFMGFPSAKDTTYNERCPGKSCAVILTYANYLWFKEFEHLSKTERKKNDKYNKLKKYFEERMLSETFKYYPQLKDHITNVLIGTPLTFNYYIGSTFGEVYGMDSTRARYNCTKIKPETSIENLFLTGQDVTTLGITGAIMSGVLTSMTMLGYGTWIDCISGRNIVDDTKHFNDRAE